MSIFIAPAASAPPMSSAHAPASLRSPYAAPAQPHFPLPPPALAASPSAAGGVLEPWDPQALTAATVRPSPAAPRASHDAAKPALPFLWGRLAFATGVLLVILVAGFVAKSLGFDDWSTLMLHSFELLLGIFMGLLGGEISERSGGDRR